MLPAPVPRDAVAPGLRLEILMDKPGNGSLSLSDRVRSLRLPDKANEPQPFPIVPWSLCFVLGLGCIGLAFAAFRPRVQAEAAVPQAASTSATSTEIAATKSAAAPVVGPGGVILESKGYIVPVHQIQVSPKVGGMVMELFIEEGMHVKEGDVLAQLETTEYQHDYDRVAAQAKAAKHKHEELTKYRDVEIKQAKAELEDAVALRNAAEKDFRRNSELIATRAVSPRDLEQAESSYRSLEARVRRAQLTLDLWTLGPRDEKIAAAKAEHEQIVAERDKNKWRLDNTIVRAPVSGTILTKRAEKGNQINPSAFSNGLAASLCDMADLSDMEVDLAVAERDIAKVYKAQRCRIVAEAYPDRPYEGEVSRIMPQADRAKGAVPVRVKLMIPREEEGRYLRPDMGAIVTFYNKTGDAPPGKTP
jgi:HlyD family secretion protein